MLPIRDHKVKYKVADRLKVKEQKHKYHANSTKKKKSQSGYQTIKQYSATKKNKLGVHTTIGGNLQMAMPRGKKP